MKKKTNQYKDLKTKSKEDLLKLLAEEQNKWLHLKMDLKINKLKDVHLARKKRHEIARIKTALHLRSLK